MNDITTKNTVQEESAVDDVRRIREMLDRESGGDIRKHIEQTNRLVEECREKLGLKVLQPPARTKRRDGTSG